MLEQGLRDVSLVADASGTLTAMPRSESAPGQPSPTDPSDGAQIAHMLDTARQMLDEEWKIADRLEQKARSQVTATGALFAVVQAAATAALGQPDAPRGLAWTLGVLAVLAAVATAVAFIRSGWSLLPTDEKALPLTKLRDNYLPHAERGEPVVGRHLVDYHFRLVSKRRSTNSDRAADVKRAAIFCLVAVILAALELVTAIVIRLVGVLT